MDRISAYKKSVFSNRSIGNGTARLISDLMNPFFVPPLVIVTLASLMGGSAISWITAIAVLFYMLIPFASALYLLHTNRISSLDLPERKSRQRLYAISFASAAVASTCFFLVIPVDLQLVAIISLVFPVNALMGIGINGKWKISVHTATLSTAAAIFLYLLYIDILSSSGLQILPLIVVLLLLLVMMWARYRLNVHTLAELFGGAASGFLLTFLQLTILINLW